MDRGRERKLIYFASPWESTSQVGHTEHANMWRCCTTTVQPLTTQACPRRAVHIAFSLTTLSPSIIKCNDRLACVTPSPWTVINSRPRRRLDVLSSSVHTCTVMELKRIEKNCYIILQPGSIRWMQCLCCIM